MPDGFDHDPELPSVEKIAYRFRRHKLFMICFELDQLMIKPLGKLFQLFEFRPTRVWLVGKLSSNIIGVFGARLTGLEHDNTVL